MMKRKYFESYHLPHALVRLLEGNIPLSGKRKNKRIFQEDYFTSPKTGIKKITEGYFIIKNGITARVRNKLGR